MGLMACVAHRHKLGLSVCSSGKDGPKCEAKPPGDAAEDEHRKSSD